MHSPTSRRALLAAAALAALPGCGSSSAPRSGPSPSSSPSRLSSAAPPPRPRLDLSDLETAFDGRIGAWATDVATGVTVGWREDERFPLASTFKMLAAAAVVERGGLNERVRWTSRDRVDPSPITDKHLNDGLTVAQLCEATVTVSDNTAGNLLLRRLSGPSAITRYARAHGDTVTRLDRWEPELNDWRPGELRDTTTPAAVGGLAARIAADDGEVLAWMRKATTGTTRIRAGPPRDWTIGDKTGTGGTYGTANDVAIAHPPTGGPLIFAVYTNRRRKSGDRHDATLARTATRLHEALRRTM